MFCSNYVEYWLLTLAVWSCGGCVMPVNCEMEAAALQHQIVDAGAKVSVINRSLQVLWDQVTAIATSRNISVT